MHIDPEPVSARAHVSGDSRRSRRSAPAPRVSRKGRFHRPELTTPWQKFSGNLAVRIVFAVLLVGVTAGVVWMAISRFAL
ncbi:hypothetical protein N1031_01450 [Herbiconiux moechotypicola]|uniref:Uncharacterized protein n=1 Tax=Herbiconiux moechotypicola TaxID=637393 RepID=A0ABP5Q1I5_9MICO|nr:hypothetical protein [Herbiconiux moechotypicola]MCS5728418.1 hypothetical protein [Herbiconiux moechotypicola]